MSNSVKSKLHLSDFAIHWFNDNLKAHCETLNIISTKNTSKPALFCKAVVSRFKSVYRRNLWNANKAANSKFIYNSYQRALWKVIKSKISLPNTTLYIVSLTDTVYFLNLGKVSFIEVQKVIKSVKIAEA